MKQPLFAHCDMFGTKACVNFLQILFMTNSNVLMKKMKKSHIGETRGEALCRFMVSLTEDIQMCFIDVYFLLL